MNPTDKLTELNDRLRDLQQAAAALEDNGKDIPAIYRNMRRISACIKMLEIHIADAV